VAGLCPAGTGQSLSPHKQSFLKESNYGNPS
jgi:hypothetical protein